MEVEVKFLEVDVPVLVQRLESLGAKKVFDGALESVYFDYGDKRLAGGKKLLRLRRKGSFAELTLKERVSADSAKVCDEREVVVNDFDGLRSILHSLGLVEFARYSKHRCSYLLDGAHYEFDTFEGVPTLLEVEVGDVRSLENACSIIGLSLSDSVAWSGKDVLRHYGKQLVYHQS